MADFRINVIVDPTRAVRSTRLVNNALGETERRANRLRGVLVNAFNFAGIPIGITQLIRLGDAYTGLTNRVRVATEGAAFSNEVLGRVFDIANRARGPVAQLTFLYQRLSIASGELGASQEEVLSFVNATAQALAAQGGTTAEAAGALIQLSQALGNARIQAQEFNSLVDGAFPLVQAAARGIDEAGGSVARLRQLILQGRITNRQFFEGVLSQGQALADTFATTTVTISQAFNVLQNNLIEFIGTNDQALGVTRSIAEAMLTLANNMDLVAQTALFAGSIIAGNLVGRGLVAAEFAIRSLFALIAANPIGALLTVLGAVTLALIGFGDRIPLLNSGLATVEDLGTAAFTRISDAISETSPQLEAFGQSALTALEPLLDFAGPIADSIREAVGEIELSFGGVVLFMARVADTSLGIWIGWLQAIRAIFSRLPDVLGSIAVDAVNRLNSVVEDGINTIITQLNRLDTFVGFEPTELISFPSI